MRYAALFMLFLSLSVDAAGQAAASWPARPGHVEASLASADTSIKPGAPLTVGVLLRMDPEWHVYWRNPGQSGLPTTVDWKLPTGWSAKPLRWPVPERFETAGIVTYGYSNDVLLTAELTPPAGLAVGTSTVIGARVTWLACRVECTPGTAELSLSLPVRSGEPIADNRWAAAFARARAALPAGPSAAHVTARASKGTITLVANGWAGRGRSGAAFYPGSEGLIDDAAPQVVERSGDALVLTLKRPPDSKVPTRLEGILVLGQGRRWKPPSSRPHRKAERAFSLPCCCPLSAA